MSFSSQTLQSFNPPAPLVWINGFPGVGKLTIAKSLLQSYGHDKAVLIDNHQLIDPVAQRYQRGDPEYLSARHDERRKAFDRWANNAHEKDRIIIFTDFQSDNELGREVAMEYAAVAKQSGRLFIPVYIDCKQDENLRRAASAERACSGTTKLLDTKIVRELLSEHRLFAFGLPSELRLDVTNISPQQSANMIFDHVAMITQ